MAIKILLAVAAVGALFFVWRYVVLILLKYIPLLEEPVKNLNTLSYFWKPLVLGTVLGFILGRVLFLYRWTIQGGGVVLWSIFPYVKVEGKRVWFTHFPWVVLRFWEGLEWWVLPFTIFVVMAFYIIRLYFLIKRKSTLTAAFSERLVGLVSKALFFLFVFSGVLLGFILIQ